MGVTRFLLDTNVISEPLRPRPDQALVHRLEEHQQRVAIPSPVWHELLFGCFRLPESRRREAIETYLLETVRSSFPILSYDGAAAQWHARERARLESLGQLPPIVDGQIAAIAAVHRVTLVTANLADFERFDGLEITSWRSDAGDRG